VKGRKKLPLGRIGGMAAGIVYGEVKADKGENEGGRCSHGGGEGNRVVLVRMQLKGDGGKGGLSGRYRVSVVLPLQVGKRRKMGESVGLVSLEGKGGRGMGGEPREKTTADFPVARLISEH